jgi:hypothetical protein
LGFILDFDAILDFGIKTLMAEYLLQASINISDPNRVEKLPDRFLSVRIWDIGKF